MPHKRPATGRLADRVFVGACTAACLALFASVVAALTLYGSGTP